MIKKCLITLTMLMLISVPSYGYIILENIPSGTGAGFVSMEVGQGGYSNRISIGTDQWVGVGDLVRKVDADATEDAVLLFTVGTTVDATWLSDSSAWTVVASSLTGSSQYTTTIERTVGGATVTVKTTTTLNAAPNTTIHEKYEITVTGDVLENVKLFAYNDFSLDLGTGDRAYPVGDALNTSGDIDDYSLVTGSVGSGLALSVYDSYVSSGGVPAPPINQIDIAIGMREVTTVSGWETNAYGSILLQDLVDGYITDLDLLNSDVTGGALMDNESAFQYNLGTLSIQRSATVEYDKVMGVNAVPEPSTFLLIGMGLLGLGIYRKKQ